MKLFRFHGSLFLAAAVAFLSSCGSGGNEKPAVTDSTAAADSAAKAQAANTIVTTPENMVTITHKVANYDKWLAAYEAHDSARMAAGLHNYVIGRGVQDSNMVLVALKVDDTAKARAFSKDPGLRKAMKKGGVVGAPTIFLSTETWQDTAHLDPTVIRSMVSLTVKDWDAFMKSFEDGKQERADNGIMARVVGHDLDDNKKVAVVVALSDTAKAFAYYRSDTFKKRIESGTVVGQPVRFLFHIVKRY
ncbi:MAG TPA: hypothetical protein VKU83_02705 [Puia sp.]|nr:hypothetical protein [Puia sp.]